MSDLKLLEEIRDKLCETKDSISIVLSSIKTGWCTRFSPPLYLNPNKKYEMALLSLETYYSIPNINETNNTFVYHNGSATKTITIPTGSFEILGIDEEIRRQMKNEGDWDTVLNKPYIKIGINKSTLKSSIEITNEQYIVNMDASNIRTVLGFEARALSGISYNEGDRTANILSVNSILVTCDIVGGSYRDGISLPIIYSFFPDSEPGEKIIESPKNLVYLPITASGSINHIELKLLDQNENPIDLRGEIITIRIHIRSI